MKNLIFTITLLSSFIQAQNIFPASGSAGIGTRTPEGKLQIIHEYEDSRGNTLILGKKSLSNLRLGYNKEYSWIHSHINKPLYINEFENNTILNMRQGNVGVGTPKPLAKLHILNKNQNSNGNTLILGPRSASNLRLGYNKEYSWIQSHGKKPLYINELSNNTILNLRRGKVGIGTKNPDSKLTVKGKIHAEEVLVDLAVPADYVFEKYYNGASTLKANYTMPTLEEVAKFTKENKHLPAIPSAKEIKEKGLKVGEMTNLLLQKIEELTLYTIEQQKQIDALINANKNK